MVATPVFLVMCCSGFFMKLRGAQALQAQFNQLVGRGESGLAKEV